MPPPLAWCSKARVSGLTALELEPLSSGLQKDTHSFYHLLTFLPSPYFIGDKVKAVSVKVPMTLKFSNFSECMKCSQIQRDNPHMVMQFFCFLNLISCLTSCKKYLLSQTELTVHREDIWLPLLKQVKDHQLRIFWVFILLPYNGPLQKTVLIFLVWSLENLTRYISSSLTWQLGDNPLNTCSLETKQRLVLLQQQFQVDGLLETLHSDVRSCQHNAAANIW